MVAENNEHARAEGEERLQLRVLRQEREVLVAERGDLRRLKLLVPGRVGPAAVGPDERPVAHVTHEKLTGLIARVRVMFGGRRRRVLGLLQLDGASYRRAAGHRRWDAGANARLLVRLA